MKKNQINRLPVTQDLNNNKLTAVKNVFSVLFDKPANTSDPEALPKQQSPEVDIIHHLIDFEKKIDDLVKKKRFDLQQLYMRTQRKFKKILRVHVIHEIEKHTNRLKLKGYIFPYCQETQDIKFTGFFKQIGFKFSNENYSSTTWKRSQPNIPQKDGVIINLTSNQKTSLEISFYMISSPPKFKIDPYLQRIVKMQSGTRIAILQAIWQYIKMHKLQDAENKQTINTDEAMKNAFKCQKMPFSSINGRIRQLLTPVDPLTISLILSDKPEQKIYDFIVEVEGKSNIELNQKTNNPGEQRTEKAQTSNFLLNQKIKKIDKAIEQHTQKLKNHASKQQIYKNFNQNTIQQIVKQQHEILKQLNEANKKEEDINHIEFLFQNEDQIEKQIKNYLQQLPSDD